MDGWMEIAGFLGKCVDSSMLEVVAYELQDIHEFLCFLICDSFLHDPNPSFPGFPFCCP